MNGSRQLLCTFTNPIDLKKLCCQLYDFYDIYNNNIFVFYNTNEHKQLFLTYNIYSKHLGLEKFPNTVSIHRKRETNTLYTLNAMNQLIKDENGGLFDNTFKVNWGLYKNTLILTNDISVKVIDIKIFDINRC